MDEGLIADRRVEEEVGADGSTMRTTLSDMDSKYGFEEGSSSFKVGRIRKNACDLELVMLWSGSMNP